MTIKEGFAGEGPRVSPALGGREAGSVCLPLHVRQEQLQWDRIKATEVTPLKEGAWGSARHQEIRRQETGGLPLGG